MESFKTTFEQPVTMKDLIEIDDPSYLSDEFSRLNHSIELLVRSNEEIRESENEDWCKDDPETGRVLKEAYEENLISIAKKRERAKMLKLALDYKLGVNSNNPHYKIQKEQSKASEQCGGIQSVNSDQPQEPRVPNDRSPVGQDSGRSGGVLL
ncbi:hypothetical protein BY996DRAFT_325232 [Phakopsora pachyrhizi]|nr:hypothetical protein BY996DRAFT_325232 [Phakopsora pachyrhizi]